jgi:NAD(P)-dependent dehydrogenase (short-subunit alcohol dehydrogenase family)
MTQYTNEHFVSVGLLANKVVLVTGAGRGIGAAAARIFAREGASVMLISRTESELSAGVEEIRSAGRTADYVVADIADPAGIERAITMTVQRYGRLDAAFNNAGRSLPSMPLVDVTEEQFDMISSANYKSVWLNMVAEIRAIRRTAGSGAIVNNSSVSSLAGFVGIGAYNSTKGAINSLTQTAAAEYGPEGIRINAIAPGTTMTVLMKQWATEEPAIIKQLNAHTPLRRAGQPDEIAEAATWLLSDRASFINGVILPVDGGLLAQRL